MAVLQQQDAGHCASCEIDGKRRDSKLGEEIKSRKFWKRTKAHRRHERRTERNEKRKTSREQD